MDRQHWGRHQDQESISLESVQTFQSMEINTAQIDQNKSIQTKSVDHTTVWVWGLGTH